MTERITASVNQEPKIDQVLGVHKLTWMLDDEELEACMGVAKNKKELTEHLSLISRLNGSHPLKIVELEDAYLPISVNESIEVYDSPQPSDSPTSKLEYIARERNRPRRFYVQWAKYGLTASIHEHEPESWERYDWIKGRLGLLLPSGGHKVITHNSRLQIIPGEVKHQTVGLSPESSITLITTTAKQHIHSSFL